jgi:hypothetical protein
MIYSQIIVDEKQLQPHDVIGCSSTWDSFPTADTTKPEIGRVQITNLKSGEVTKVNNLVLLKGREVLLQKLLGIGDKLNYNIRYFRVGDGGCTIGTTPSKIGPFDDDEDLNNVIAFNPNGNSLGSGDYKYIHDGKSKAITSDNGSIEIINEFHTVSKVTESDSTEITGEWKTTVKFTMYVLPSECTSLQPDGTAYTDRVFRFNEASLLLLNTDESDNNVPAGTSDEAKFNADFTTFARFTTLTKYLEAQDGIKIEWFILV